MVSSGMKRYKFEKILAINPFVSMPMNTALVNPIGNSLKEGVVRNRESCQFAIAVI
jgi:hypothetical protein